MPGQRLLELLGDVVPLAETRMLKGVLAKRLPTLAEALDTYIEKPSMVVKRRYSNAISLHPAKITQVTG
jgi:hypothetical protein